MHASDSIRHFHKSGITGVTNTPLPEIVKGQVTILPVSTSLDQREVITALKNNTANPGIFVPTTAEDLNALNMSLSSEPEQIRERLNTELLAEEKNQAMYDAQRHAVPVHKYVHYIIHVCVYLVI